jgi:hypothetical protein
VRWIKRNKNNNKKKEKAKSKERKSWKGKNALLTTIYNLWFRSSGNRFSHQLSLISASGETLAQGTVVMANPQPDGFGTKQARRKKKRKEMKEKRKIAKEEGNFEIRNFLLGLFCLSSFHASSPGFTFSLCKRDACCP